MKILSNIGELCFSSQVTCRRKCLRTALHLLYSPSSRDGIPGPLELVVNAALTTFSSTTPGVSHRSNAGIFVIPSIKLCLTEQILYHSLVTDTV